MKLKTTTIGNTGKPFVFRYKLVKKERIKGSKEKTELVLCKWLKNQNKLEQESHH